MGEQPPIADLHQLVTVATPVVGRIDLEDDEVGVGMDAVGADRGEEKFAT